MENKDGTSSKEEQNPVVNPVVKTPEIKYPYTASEKVYIFPAQQKSVLPETGTVINSAEMYIVRIGSAFSAPNSDLQLGRTVLSLEEEQEYMPKIIGVTPKSETWEKALNLYWMNLSVPVDLDGLELEIGFVHTSPTTKFPISVRDYVLYRYCLKYYDVVQDKSEIHKSKKIRFYMEKPEELKKEKINKQRLKDEATATRLTFQKDSNKVKALLAIKEIGYEDDTDMVIALAEFSEKNPQEFLDLTKDKELIAKGMIMTMIRRGILQKPMDSTIIFNGTETIGGNLSQAVAWFNDPTNGVESTKLQARLKESKL